MFDPVEFVAQLVVFINNQKIFFILTINITSQKIKFQYYKYSLY